MPLTGPIELSDNRYGKSENRIVRIRRDGPRHEIRDVNVSTTLRGDFADAYISGDQSAVLPTDTQKQTAYAFAKQPGLSPIEEHGLALARHLSGSTKPLAVVLLGPLLSAETLLASRRDGRRVLAGGRLPLRGRRVRAWQANALRWDLCLVQGTRSPHAGKRRVMHAC